MTKSKIRLKVNKIDLATKSIAFLSMMGIGVITFLYYPELPETIPVNYNFLGMPTKFGDKSLILIIPFLGLVLYLTLEWLTRHPQLFLYPVKITEQNKEWQYNNAIRMIKVAFSICLVSLAYLLIATMKIAFGDWEKLGNAFGIVVIIGILFSFLYFSIKSLNAK